jgi:hypothetical protein
MATKTSCVSYDTVTGIVGTDLGPGIVDGSYAFHAYGILNSTGTYTADILIPSAADLLSSIIVYGIDAGGNLTQVTGTATAGANPGDPAHPCL